MLPTTNFIETKNSSLCTSSIRIFKLYSCFKTCIVHACVQKTTENWTKRTTHQCCCPRCKAIFKRKFENVAFIIFRVTLLELISAQLNEEDSGNCDVPPTVAHFLAGSFQKGCGAVLTLATGPISNDEVRTVRTATSIPSPLFAFWYFLLFLGEVSEPWNYCCVYEPACLLRFLIRSCRRHWLWSVCWMSFVKWPQTSGSSCSCRTTPTCLRPLLVSGDTLRLERGFCNRSDSEINARLILLIQILFLWLCL